MTKKEIKEVVRLFLEDKVDRENISLDDLFNTMGGCAFWEEKKHIRKAMVVRFLAYQCRYLNGNVNDQELSDCCNILKRKVIMID